MTRKNIIKIFLIFPFFIFAFWGFLEKIGAQEKLGAFSQSVEESFTVSSLEHVSSVQKTDFSFTAVASFWSKDFSAIELYLRTGKEKNGLGEWLRISRLEEDLPDKKGEHNFWSLGEIINTEPSSFFQYKIKFSSQDIDKSFQIKFIVFDARRGWVPQPLPNSWIPQLSTTKISNVYSGLGPSIISRSGWGANEGYMTWEPEYSEVKAIVIHHTAGEEKTHINQIDAVRNLYYGHAVLYGWGDIGYNYIIDVEGNIYEGRYGGNGVIGGHTLGYNTGTIGVTLIGDYNVRNVDTVQYNALIDLLAYLSYINYLDPQGEVFLKNKNISTIVGHRDLNATSCPGNTLYGRLNDIRAKTAEKLSTYPSRKYSAQFISLENNVKIFGGDKKKVKISLKNTGNTFWLAEGDHRIKINNQTSTDDLTTSLIDFGRSIEPGEIANLEIEITAGFVNKNKNYAFELIQDGQIIAGSSFNININIETPPYKAKVISQSANQIIRPGKQATIWLEIENRGTEIWNGKEKIKLATKNDKESLFYTKGNWVDKKTVGFLDADNIKTQEKIKFSFLVTAPLQSGQYRERFVLVSDKYNLEGAEDLEAEWYFVVGENEAELTGIDKKTYSKDVADYNYEIINQSDYINMLPGETREMFIEVRNTGNTNWYSDIFRLATFRDSDRESIFADNSWLSPARIEMNQYKVAPGDIARFDFTVTAPSGLGVYREYFNFVAENIGWLKDQGIFWQIIVSPPIYQAELLEQSAYINTTRNMPAVLTVKFKNIGNIPWEKNVVHLGTSRPYDRESIFADSTWLSSNRIEFLEEEVKPNEIATFQFTINTDQDDGDYQEYFSLVAEGKEWFSDIGLFWKINVKPPFDDFQYLAQSPFISLAPGEKDQLWLEVKNTGTKVWNKNGDYPVRLATSRPQDRKSIFLDSNRIEMDKETVKSQEIVRFTFTITAPNIPGTYKEYFALVRDGIAWFSDIGIYWEIEVRESNNQENNESSNQEVRVSASGPFIIVDGNDKKITEGDEGDVVKISYQEGKYYLSLNTNYQLPITNYYIRIVPWATHTILTIDSYEDHPSWNPALNDNKFKGVIEIRYSPTSNKLWIINELNIEDYLKGVSESLNSFDLEYLKAAAVAQRSYVYHHFQNGGRHPDDFLTLKNSRNGNGDDQIYQGCNFTLRAPNIVQAVEATRGEVVTYNDQPVITPYFNQSDGRTRSANEVWGWNQDDYPWLISVPDPYCEGYSLQGHGVGMSGRGARGLVSEGKNYKEVLQYYYPGTEIGKIDTNINVRIGIYSINF